MQVSQLSDETTRYWQPSLPILKDTQNTIIANFLQQVLSRHSSRQKPGMITTTSIFTRVALIPPVLMLAANMRIHPDLKPLYTEKESYTGQVKQSIFRPLSGILNGESRVRSRSF